MWNSRRSYVYFLRIILNIWVFNILLCLVQVARFWYWRASGVAFVRRHQKLSVWWTEPFPAGSKVDLPLAKDEHISDRGRTSVIAHLRSIKQHGKTERTENMWEKQLWQHQSQRRSGQEVLKELEKSFSPEPVMKTVVTHIDPLQLMEVHSGIDTGGHTGEIWEETRKDFLSHLDNFLPILTETCLLYLSCLTFKLVRFVLPEPHPCF